MPHPIAVLALSVSALLGQESEAARLVPADAELVVRVESARALNELVRAFAPLDGRAAAFDLQAKLDALRGGSQQSGSEQDRALEPPPPAPVLDAERPLYLALPLAPHDLAATLVAPVANGAEFRFRPELFGGRERCVRLGAYTGVSLAPGYAASDAPNPLVATLRPGVIALRVDLARVIARFRPLIDMVLRQLDVELDGQLDQTPAITDVDGQALVEVYLAGLRTLLDSAQSLDLALEHEGDWLALRFDYREKEARGPVGSVGDVSALFGYVDGLCSQFAFDGKWTESAALLGDFAEALIECYPEAWRADLRGLLARQRELDPLVAPGMVAGVDFGADGVRAAYVLRSPRAGELVAALEGLVRGLDHPQGLLRVGAAERLVVGGLEARVVPLALEYEALHASLAAWMEHQGKPMPGTSAEFRGFSESLVGRDLRLALAAKGELVWVGLAASEGEVRAGLERFAAPLAKSTAEASTSTASTSTLARAWTCLEPGALGFAYHLDLGHLLERAVEVERKASGSSASFHVPALSMDVFGSHRERLWTGGARLRIAEIAELVRGLQASAR